MEEKRVHEEEAAIESEARFLPSLLVRHNRRPACWYPGASDQRPGTPLPPEIKEISLWNCEGQFNRIRVNRLHWPIRSRYRRCTPVRTSVT